jgi:hypothetical protein
LCKTRGVGGEGRGEREGRWKIEKMEEMEEIEKRGEQVERREESK